MTLAIAFGIYKQRHNLAPAAHHHARDQELQGVEILTASPDNQGPVARGRDIDAQATTRDLALHMSLDTDELQNPFDVSAGMLQHDLRFDAEPHRHTWQRLGSWQGIFMSLFEFFDLDSLAREP